MFRYLSHRGQIIRDLLRCMKQDRHAVVEGGREAHDLLFGRGRWGGERIKWAKTEPFFQLPFYSPYLARIYGFLVSSASNWWVESRSQEPFYFLDKKILNWPIYFHSEDNSYTRKTHSFLQLTTRERGERREIHKFLFFYVRSKWLNYACFLLQIKLVQSPLRQKGSQVLNDRPVSPF